MYKLLSMNNEVFGAYKEENGIRISFTFDPDNTDFVEYQKWLDAGNTPLPAEETL